MHLKQDINKMGVLARQASHQLASTSTHAKNNVLSFVSQALEEKKNLLFEANQKDLLSAKQAGLSGPKLERLILSERRIKELKDALQDVIRLPDPVGSITNMGVRPNGLKVGRMKIPIGVIAIIYESRPNVTLETASLCLKSGNAVILRGGSEAFHSNQCLHGFFQEGLLHEHLPREAVQLVQTTDRSAILHLCQLDNAIDVIIPRGGESLVHFVTEHARMPVLKHYKGVCHVFIDQSADPKMASQICVNSKAQRPGVCNAMETLLVHETFAQDHLPTIADALDQHGVEIRGCEKTCKQLKNCLPAKEEDWSKEYLNLTLSVAIMPSFDEALQHIYKYSSNHTEAIVTNDYNHAQRFTQHVQSSLVLVNASTRFNDGYQLGLGAEMGISTSKIHAFGPMGLEELTTTKFIAFGNGQIRCL